MRMFKSSCVALAVVAAGGASALAADLPSRTVVPVAPVVVIPLFTWTGFYAGVNAGYGSSTNDSNDRFDPYTGVFYGNDSSNGGFVGGGQVGYNYQFGQFVAGVEADIQYADLGSSRNNNDWAYSYSAYYYAQSNSGWPYAYGQNGRNNAVEWFGTVRARLGVAFDRVLVYATGGFAYGGGDNNNNNGYYGYYGGEAAASGYPWYYGGRRGNSNSGGWVVGGGLEYAFTDSLTAKLEGLYVNLGSDKNNDGDYLYAYNYTTPVAYPYYYGARQKNDREFAVVRAGLNYRFGGF
ncbi:MULTISPECIES: porin family protein [unclassified Chelatococcus]|uniref:outer membrane protein n=1 Tax=unclassified Chelatococcus TaxID=2638111 RepID=UPI001BCB298E|nr:MULTISPECIES: porin family protein [unclassified Chelatococcus]CAH1671328.1 Outer membrane immunogenic protein [Hyphomicrobiales bacterium]MBS7738448.1 porin family protein [Chelatococcus sp. HY11]MBX3542852.1 porin family protein [Chelatococcus sp.]MCO5077022.1 porin family protein [Chelatococcus sp.]CAH1676463.1 Outer membrane immunogenic protein [Hyphomicrobiales bacterium]